MFLIRITHYIYVFSLTSQLSSERTGTMETAYKEIKEMDPGTAITKWAIRKAVTEGFVPSRRVGSKYVFNLDALLDYFNVRA